MEQRMPVIKSRRGVTLVEVIIALVIMLVVFMGLMQASLLSINSNLRNSIRDEATRIASEEMTNARSLFFDNILTAAPVTRTRMFRNMSVNYTVTRTVTDLNPVVGDNRQIQVAVSYRVPGDAADTVFSINSLVRR